LDEILNELFELNNHINSIDGEKVIERYRNEFRLNRGNIKIKGIVVNYGDNYKFIKFRKLISNYTFRFL